jgi:hypothetical protein
MSLLEQTDLRPDVAAAQRGGDPNQGMPDEPDLGTSSRDEAVFWRDLYKEILTMEEGVMLRVRELMASQRDEARREVELSNVPVIAAQIERFRLRGQFWSRRAVELA